MRKTKKITAMMLSAAILVSSVFAVYAEEKKYYNSELPDIDFAEMDYSPYDTSAFETTIENINKDIAQKGKDEEITSLLDEASADIDKAVSVEVILNIKSSQVNTEENNSKKSDAYDLVNKMQQKLNSVYDNLYNSSSYRYLLANHMGEEELQKYTDHHPAEEYYTLSSEEEKLIDEYNANQFGSYVMKTDDGGEYTYSQLMDKINSDSTDEIDAMRDIPEDRELYFRYYRESNAILGDIFRRLVSVRQKIAASENYSSYEDYVNKEIYGRDFSKEDTAAFRNFVVSDIVPVYKAMRSISGSMSAQTYAGSDEEIVSTVGKYVHEINGELGDTFDYMIKHKLIDMAYSDKKTAAGNAYTAGIPSYNSAFMFMSPEEDDQAQGWKLKTLIHEFGHFSSIINELSNADKKDNAEDPVAIESIELAETHSQGLECLFSEYYNKVFGDDASAKKLDFMTDMLSGIIDGCIYDEWQSEIYAAADMSLSDINKEYKRLMEKYGYTITGENGEGYSWIGVTHNFDSPFYYLSYAISAVSALEIWEDSINDRKDAVDKYMRVSAAGLHVKFADTISKCGLGNVFSADTIAGINSSLGQYFCLGYSDVDTSAWYYKYLVGCAGYIIDGASSVDADGNTYSSFAPDNASTHEVTAAALGKLYEKDGNAIDAKESFTDVNGENAKYIAEMKEDGVLQGIDGTTFDPEADVTREDAAVMLYRFASAEKSALTGTKGTINFSDADSISDYAKDAVSWAQGCGILNGYEDDTIRAKGNITRAELMKMADAYESAA